MTEVMGSPVECSEIEPLEEKQDDRADDDVVGESDEISASETDTSEKSKAETGRHIYSRVGGLHGCGYCK